MIQISTDAETVLFTTCFLDGVDPTGSSYLERVKKWLDYYLSLQGELKFDYIVMTDNGSSFESLKALGAQVRDADDGHYLIYISHKPVIIYRHSQRLSKQKVLVPNDYPYVWRGLNDMVGLTTRSKVKKIIRVDTDAFILSKSLVEKINELNSEWTAMTCYLNGKKMDHPEDAISVLCEDQFMKARELCSAHYSHHFGKMFEKTIPFTQVLDFVGGRYGESKPPPQQDTSMDYYCQCPVDVPMNYEIPF